ncbi:MAG TPA: tail fiber domain-containing protein [Phnomibacter sp.]|nr:tail fiber domain-containing protein [Phnomibacter sp.]
MKWLFTFSFLSITGFVQAQGNVGIGITNPTLGRLQTEGVAVAGSATTALFGSGSTGISFQRNWPTIGFNQYRDVTTPGSQGKYMGNGFAAIQYFDPNSGIYAFDLFTSGIANTSTPPAVRGVTITNNGHTSIQTGNNSASLFVGRGTAPDGTAAFYGPQYWSHFNYSTNEDTYIRSGVDGGGVMINQIPNGSVLVGTTSCRISINNPGEIPAYTIEVRQPADQKAFALIDVNNYRWAWKVQNTNTLDHGRGQTLDLYYNNGGEGRFQYWDGAYATFSDARMKEDIRPLEPVLDKMKKLRTVRYEMARNNPTHELSIGMIAQEVQPLFPTLVRQVVDHNDGRQPIKDAHVMDYSGFSILAIKALQEQEKQIRELQKQKEELLKRLEQLEKQL